MTKILNRIPILAALTLAVSACISDPSLYGKVKQYSTTDKKSFVFSIDESFIRKHEKSNKDENYPLMTEAEVKLLKSLLMQNDYCLNDESKPSFKINSRQEKIYDVTFAHLIEQSYNAKPVSPRMYFGQCL